MIEFFLASGLSCSSSQELLNRVNEYARRTQSSETYIQEVIDVIKEDNPECFYDEGSVHD